MIHMLRGKYSSLSKRSHKPSSLSDGLFRLFRVLTWHIITRGWFDGSGSSGRIEESC